MTDSFPSFYAGGMTNGGEYLVLLAMTMPIVGLCAWLTRIETRLFLQVLESERCQRSGLPGPILLSRRGWHEICGIIGCAWVVWLTFSAFGLHQWVLGACFYAGMLVSLARIDAYTGFLPDRLNYLLLWTGLVMNLWQGWQPLETAVIGVIFGYLILKFGQLFCRLMTQRDGIGNGDLKFSAALGAWCGYAQLPGILLIASCLALCAQMLLVFSGRQKRSNPIPFGPFLALGGLWGLFACLSRLS
jgi:prepilin signal peptidase PulO-like enzyme (type II secretory pathway)